MFGFFKNKAKDKAITKDKSSDITKDKKKEKANKEEKEAKVAIRKGKDDRSTKSIFRKSKSIERVKDSSEEPPTTAKKTKSLGARGSGGWTDSDHDDSTRQQNESDGNSPQENSSSSEGVPSQKGTSQDNRPTPSSTLWRGEREAKSDIEIRAKTNYVGNTTSSAACMLAREETSFVTGTEEKDDQVRTVTQSSVSESGRAASGSASPLVMKPPLNPRVVAPRGPLATSSFTHILTAELTAVEREESRYTPSPSLVTPPSSPGLPCAQAVPPYPIVTGPSSRPTSPDGRTSMLSTPSSSTSSLSSLSARPISPSGRRTPPGPRLGTGGRLASSPTSGRKATRPNIKTNPTVVPRRAGSRSPVNPSPSTADPAIPVVDGDMLKTPPSSPDANKRLFLEQKCNTVPEVQCSTLSHQPVGDTPTPCPPPTAPETTHPLSPTKIKTQLPLATVKPRISTAPSPPPKICFPCEVKSETSSKLAPRSVSPTAGKSRHSISSMHSLESIPENDSEGQTSATDTLEKNRKTKAYLGSKATHPLPVAKENKESVINGTAARLSVKDVSLDGQSHCVSHKRSSSLTPVNEERSVQSSSTIGEPKLLSQDVKASELPQSILHNNGPVGDTVAKTEKYILENIKSKPISSQNKKEDKCERHREDVQTGRVHSSRLASRGSGSEATSRAHSPKVSPEGTIPPQMKVSEANKETALATSFLISQPVVASLAIVKESGKMKVNVNRENKVNNEDIEINDPEQSSKSQKPSKGIGATTATHVVFRIPLHNTTLTNGKDKEGRVSVEILSGQDRDSIRKTKEHRKERPRSLSTSRELRRERTSETLPRRRLASEGSECGGDYIMDGDRPEATTDLRERVRRRSSSSIRRQRTREAKNCEGDEARSTSVSNDQLQDGDEVVVPWRRSTRSRTRASINSALSGSVDGVTNPNSASTEDHVKGSPARHRTRSASIGRKAGETQENDIGENNLSATKYNAIAPPRQRSKSRGSERRMTRSATLSEIKRSSDVETKTISPDSEPRRRALSSSRVGDSLREMEVANTCGTGSPVYDEEVAGVQKPVRRRRSLSRTRRTSQTEGSEDLRSESVRSRPSGKGVAIHKMVACRKEESEVLGQQYCQLTDTQNERKGNTDITNKELGISEIDNINVTEATTNDSNIGGGQDTAASSSGPARLRSPSSQDDAATTDAEHVDSDRKPRGTREVESSSVQTQVILTLSKVCQTDVEADTTQLLQDALDNTRNELAAQEERYQKQVDGLTISLAEKQQEVAALTSTIESLKAAQETPHDSEELREKLALLQQDVRDRAAHVDCLRVELQYSKNEVELTKSRLKKLEEDLDAARQKNVALQNQITATANCDKTEELKEKIESLEETLKTAQQESEKLSKTIEDIEAERDEEIKIIQDALDEAATEREELINTFEKEFQKMTSMNTAREQQLLEDFEWKLREMEKDHKKKLEERDRKAEERIRATRTSVESELADSLTRVAEDRRLADQQLTEVGHLKSYEAEAIQLRGVTHELQKALRASAREMEHLKMREKILEEEVRGLKKAQPSRQVGQSTLHRARRQAEEAEAELRQKQEKMRNELNAEWEDKLRSECSRLKAELDGLHAEEKHLAVESMKVQKEQEIRALKQSWELRQEEMTKEISTLKDSLTDKDAYYHKELENLRTNADRDVWDLRRKLQRSDEKSWSQQEYLQEKHHEEMERLRGDYKDRVLDLEARLAVAMEHSDEESRLQAEKHHNDEMEYLCEQHRLSMERLREELEAEKFQAVEEARVIVSKHLEYVNTTLREQLAEALTANNQYREELEATKSALTLREEVIASLEEDLTRVKDAEGVVAASCTTSQTSLASSHDSSSSHGSTNSQDRLSLSESVGASLDSQDDAQKSGFG
ncbi:cingulin isoform X2 [Procambarus clarkii]|uniref:cingulin isoform X2 n=1 Tax=Procambarus clarkii TaxID=6728 RepID=UPI003742AAFA